MQYQAWIENEAKIERTEKRRDTAHEHRFAPGVEPWICDILAQTPCDLEDEECEQTP